MKFIIQKQNKFDGLALMRRAGYHAHRDPYSGKMSFARRAGGEWHYPRFHVYLREGSGAIEIDLHLDQKKPSYGGGTHAHAGEYEGRVVDEEGRRIKEVSCLLVEEPAEEESKGGFFSRLFH